MTTADQEACVHHWIIEPATFVQPVSPGECQKCHKTGLFKNSVDMDKKWAENATPTKAQTSAADARQERAAKERAKTAKGPKRKHRATKY